MPRTNDTPDASLITGLAPKPKRRRSRQWVWNLAEPIVRRIFRHKLVRDATFEHAMCMIFQPQRLALPKIALPALFSTFDETPITLERLPRGNWSAPVIHDFQLCHVLHSIRATPPEGSLGRLEYITIGLSNLAHQDAAIAMWPGRGRAD